MNKLRDWLESAKGGMIFNSVIVLMLVACVFAEPVGYAVVLLQVAYLILTSHNVGFCTLLFYHPFASLYILHSFNFYNLLFMIYFAKLAIEYIVRVVKKQEKLSITSIVLMLIIIAYMGVRVLLNFSMSGLVSLASYSMLLVSIFLLSKEKQINVEKAIIFGCLGLLLSCGIALIKPLSPMLVNKAGTYLNGGLKKFQGLFLNPNHLSLNVIVALSGLMLFNLKKKSSPVFYVLFAGLLMMAYATVSRAFVLSFACLCLAFTVSDFIKNKKRALVRVAVLVLLTVVVMVAQLGITKTYLSRFGINFGADSSQQEQQDDVVEDDNEGNNIIVNDGRYQLVKDYLKDYTSSPKTILFGRGINGTLLGGLTSHNSYLHLIWMFGLVGVCLLSAFILSLFSKGSLRAVFKNWELLILVLPFLLEGFMEVVLFGCNMAFVVAIAIYYVAKYGDLRIGASDKKISIIVPMYNAEKYILEAITSLTNQTYKNIEIVVVDDGSTDNSRNIVESLSSNDKRIKLLTQENSGVSTARNLGIQNATGDIIQFMDADDTFDKHCCEFVAGSFDCDLLVYSYFTSKNNGCVLKNKMYEDAEVSQYIRDLIKGWELGLVWNKAYRADIVKTLKFDETVSLQEDLIFNLEYLKYVNSVKTCSNKLYNYRVTKSSLSRSNKCVRFEQLDRIRENMLELNDSKFNDPQLVRSINGYFLKSLVNLFRGDEYSDADILKILNGNEVKTALKNYKSNNFKERVFVWMLKHQKLELIKKLN